MVQRGSKDDSSIKSKQPTWVAVERPGALLASLEGLQLSSAADGVQQETQN